PSTRGVVTKSDVLYYLHSQPAPGAAPRGAATASGTRTPLPPAPVPAPAAVPAADTAVAPAPSDGARETRQRMTPIRARIAERLLAAQQSAAILTTFNEADMSRVMELRGRYKETFQKKHGVGLGFMGFFVKACVDALKAYPAVNARIDGQDV